MTPTSPLQSASSQKMPPCMNRNNALHVEDLTVAYTEAPVPVGASDNRLPPGVMAAIVGAQRLGQVDR